MTPKTIEEVIETLEQIIQSSKTQENPMGYFAALYYKVTISVKDKLGENYFKDDQRMEQLDVIFANRYLSAYKNILKVNQPQNRGKALLILHITKI